jgi:glucuronosyltransferase
VFSVGSAIKMSDMPDELMQSFIAVFSKLPYKVVWQWKGKPHKDLPENIKTLDWLPQQDLLGETLTFV